MLTYRAGCGRAVSHPLPAPKTRPRTVEIHFSTSLCVRRLRSCKTLARQARQCGDMVSPSRGPFTFYELDIDLQSRRGACRCALAASSGAYLTASLTACTRELCACCQQLGRSQLSSDRACSSTEPLYVPRCAAKWRWWLAWERCSRWLTRCTGVVGAGRAHVICIAGATSPPVDARAPVLGAWRRQPEHEWSPTLVNPDVATVERSGSYLYAVREKVVVSVSPVSSLSDIY